MGYTPAVSSAFWKSRPKPADENVQQIWQHVQMRVDVMTGQWQEHADERMSEFFAPEVREFLPPAEVSHNPALSIVSGISTLYDEQPVVEAAGVRAEDIVVLAPAEMWAQAQELLDKTIACNDCLAFTGYQEGRGVFTKVVTLNEVELEADPSAPDQPNYVRHLEASRRPGTNTAEWTWTTWDMRDPENPVFRVEVEDEAGEPKDVTSVYAPKLERGWPFWEGGQPVWPWTAYHRRVATRLMTPYAGRELFEGTLTAASLKTYWLAGVRDGAHPQRFALDAEALMAGDTSLTDGQAKGAKVVRMNQMGIVQFKSVGERSGQLSQFSPALDPKSAGEAIAQFSAELAVYAGVSPSDVRLGGSGGMSGYAISISRDGQRKERQKLVAPMSRSDRMRLATRARLLNAYTQGTKLPTDPEAYSIRYADVRRSLEEVKADLEEAKVLREEGLLGLVDAFMRFRPEMSREQAIDRIVQDRLEERAIAARVAMAEAGDDLSVELESIIEQMGGADDEGDEKTQDVVAQLRELLRQYSPKGE